MGLDAFVPCNCFEEGKTTQPPVDKSWIVLDEYGYYVLNPEYSKDRDLDDAVYAWSRQCCEHDGMHVWEHITNWPGLRLFQQAFAQIGSEHFPVLSTQLPDANGGQMSVEDARKSLKELEVFEQNIGKMKGLYLVGDDGQVVYEYIEAYQGRIVFSNPYGLGFNENGLFIIESKTEKILFQGQKVRQEVFFYPRWMLKLAAVVNKKMKSVRKVRWTNEAKKECFDTSFGLSIDTKNYPKTFKVEERNVNTQDYEYVAKSLRKIFETAIEMNNPIFWC